MTIKHDIAKFAVLASVLAGVATVTGCSSDDSAVLTGSDESAALRVLHASPDAPAVNVSVGNSTAIAGLDYAASSGFTSVAAGSGDITVEAIIPGGNADAVSVPDFNLIEDRRATVIAVNETATIEAYVADESAASPAADEVAIAVIHASPTAGAVNVYVTPAGQFSEEDVENGTAGQPLLENFEFGTITDHVAVPPDDYDVRVVPLSLGIAAINEEAVTLPAGVIATVIARQPNDPDALPDIEPTDFGIIVLTN